MRFVQAATKRQKRREGHSLPSTGSSPPLGASSSRSDRRACTYRQLLFLREFVVIGHTLSIFYISTALSRRPYEH